MSDGEAAVGALVRAARECRACAGDLPHEPRPVLQAEPTARLLIAGQAPGYKVHTTGLPWNDPSGDRLRQWLDLDRATFYDPARIAIVPAALCYPGKDDRGGDRPPPARCAPLWLERIRRALPRLEMTLAIGQYAQRRVLGRARKKSLTATVAAWRDYTPDVLPLPHPSWRNEAWLSKNPWFEQAVVPYVRERVRALVVG